LAKSPSAVRTTRTRKKILGWHSSGVKKMRNKRSIDYLKEAFSFSEWMVDQLQIPLTLIGIN